MTDNILIKVDFPTKPGTLYLFKGKYLNCKDDLRDGVNVIRTFKCSEGYFSYMSLRAGGFQYHSDKKEKLIEPMFFDGEWFEINEDG